MQIGILAKKAERKELRARSKEIHTRLKAILKAIYGWINRLIDCLRLSNLLERLRGLFGIWFAPSRSRRRARERREVPPFHVVVVVVAGCCCCCRLSLSLSLLSICVSADDRRVARVFSKRKTRKKKTRCISWMLRLKEASLRIKSRL